MPDPTKDEVELQRSRELIGKAWGSPELRPGLRKLLKEVMPDYQVPDDHFDVLAQPLRAQNEALAKQLEEMSVNLKQRDEAAAKREQDLRDSQYADRLEAATKRFNLTDEGRQKMIDHMKATGNYTDPLGAAAYVVSQEPPTMVPGPMYGSSTLNFAGVGDSSEMERYKLLHSGLDGPSRYLEAEIREAFGPNAKDYVAKEFNKTYAELAFAN